MYDDTGKTLPHFKFLLTKSYPVTSQYYFFFLAIMSSIWESFLTWDRTSLQGTAVLTTGQTISEVHKYHLLLIYIVQNLFT